MQKFDVLSAEAPLFGPHFLEASAGTGKTFAIEHVVAKLVMRGVPLEQILVVTFTRAATRELRLRIRATLEKFAHEPRVQDALALFENAQIFTIHGFCQRMLGLELARAEPFEAALKDFFRFALSEEIVCAEQLGSALRHCGGVAELARALRRPVGGVVGRRFPELREEFHRRLSSWSGARDLEAAFARLKPACKAAVKGDFAAQLAALAAGELEGLLREGGSLFEFLGPNNQRARMKERPEPEPFFEWGREHLLPLIEEAADPARILHAITAAWKPFEERVLAEEGAQAPDDLLRAMQHALQDDPFCQKIRGAYRAVLIDEFQDTDPLQWDIFKTLFLDAETLYLIGDPKQSIYRFRSADVYTYLAAKEAIAPEHHYYLDTNFRSSKELLGALNRLFDREWLALPKLERALPYLPVKAGLELTSDLDDARQAVHCVIFDDSDVLYAYVASEIQRLHESAWSAFAVLVKDRNQAAAIEQRLKAANIPTTSKGHELLTATLAFQAVEELFAALREPRHLGKAKTVLAGPFGGASAEKLCTLADSPIPGLRAQLDAEGLPTFCAELRRRFAAPSPACYNDLCQTLELLLAWEQTCGFSFEGLARFFAQLHTREEDAPRRFREADGDGVQILTMHSSKGLEFDVVFALGVAAKSQSGDAESEAEKLRQLYVTLTRAKRRLYVPIHRKRGLSSPIELFCQQLGDWEAALQQMPEISVEELVAMPHVEVLAPPSPAPPQGAAGSPPPTPPSYILSFTALAREHKAAPLEPLNVKPLYTLHDLPRGAETGVVIHSVLERVFGEKAWKDPRAIERIVHEQLRGSALALWEEAILQGIHHTLDLPLPVGFCLRDIAPESVLVEAEFLFQQEPNYLKGFIDLLFVHNGMLYIADWKTNWLGHSVEAYTRENMLQAMHDHDYFLQAKIYHEALARVWDGPLGGAVYLFVRGPAALCTTPEAHGRLD